MSSLGGYLLLYHSPMRSSKYLPAFGAIVWTGIIYSHCFILVVLYCFNRFSHRACVIHHYTFPVWNGRIRHLPQLHDCSFPLVSRSTDGTSLTWVGIGSQIGSAIAPLIIIPIAVAYGWRTTFYVNALIGVVWVVICYRWLWNFPAQMNNIHPQEVAYIESNRRFNTSQNAIPWKTSSGTGTFGHSCSCIFVVSWPTISLLPGFRFTW